VRTFDGKGEPVFKDAATDIIESREFAGIFKIGYGFEDFDRIFQRGYARKPGVAVGFDFCAQLDHVCALLRNSNKEV